MKFLMFSDLHRYPGVFMGGSWDALAQLQRHAEQEQCDFILHAGDFCHGPSMIPDYVEAYNCFHIPSYHALGNHDADHTSHEDVLRYYRMPHDYYFFDQGGYRMIILNPNYYRDGEQFIHYDHQNFAKFGATKDIIPPDEMKWLEKTIFSSPYPCVLVSHESLERGDGVKNQEDVRRIIHAANCRKPGSVLLCINGHNHRDFLRVLDNVCYFEMNSASFDWVESTHDFFPDELCRQYHSLNHLVAFEDPLHAIITLEGNTITIQGMESAMFMGVTREMTGNPAYDFAGRPVRPVVQSAQITLA